MALFRFQDKLPESFVNDSRDFQLVCRLYDIIINGLKYDIDGISRIIDSDTCKSTILQLLQTKLGFFSKQDFTDEALRYILKTFSIISKNKGTKMAIKQTIYMFLKANSIETDITVDIIDDKPSPSQIYEYGSQITDHCIVIGIKTDPRSVTILKEVLKHIIPFGYVLYFFFYTGSVEKTIFTSDEFAELFLISNDVNDMAGSKSKFYNKGWDDVLGWYDLGSMYDRNIATFNTTQIRKHPDQETKDEEESILTGKELLGKLSDPVKMEE